MAITAVGPTGTVDQAGFSQLMTGADGMVNSLPGSSNLRVDRVAGQDRRVTVQAGYGRVPGIRAFSSSAVTVDLPANGAAYPRRDWIVMRFSWAASPATVTITYVQGTASASPQLPGLTQSPGVQWDLPLAAVTVAAGVGALPADAVVDARYWDVAGVAVVVSRGVDPRPAGGRLLYVINNAELLAANTSEFGPTGPRETAGDLPVATGWSDAQDTGRATARYVVNTAGAAWLSGFLRRTGNAFTLGGNSIQIATLPAVARPSLNRIMPAWSRVGPVLVELTAAGPVLCRKDDAAAAFPDDGYISLDGITYHL